MSKYIVELNELRENSCAEVLQNYFEDISTAYWEKVGEKLEDYGYVKGNIKDVHVERVYYDGLQANAFCTDYGRILFISYFMINDNSIELIIVDYDSL